MFLFVSRCRQSLDARFVLAKCDMPKYPENIHYLRDSTVYMPV